MTDRIAWLHLGIIGGTAFAIGTTWVGDLATDAGRWALDAYTRHRGQHPITCPDLGHRIGTIETREPDAVVLTYDADTNDSTLHTDYTCPCGQTHRYGIGNDGLVHQTDVRRPGAETATTDGGESRD